MIKTSESHPLYVNWVKCLNGYIGLTICPGKHNVSASSGHTWERDLEADVKSIKMTGAKEVITLLTSTEIADFNVVEIRSHVETSLMKWSWYPINDGGVPINHVAAHIFSQEDNADRVSRLYNEGKIIIHCNGGLGRAGTLASLLLMAYEGISDVEAITRVRASRRGAVETKVQENWLGSVVSSTAMATLQESVANTVNRERDKDREAIVRVINDLLKLSPDVNAQCLFENITNSGFIFNDHEVLKSLEFRLSRARARSCA